jgi:hypothetical protein
MPLCGLKGRNEITKIGTKEDCPAENSWELNRENPT